MRLFFLTPSVIGSIYGAMLVLANQQVVLMGLKFVGSNRVKRFGFRVDMELRNL